MKLKKYILVFVTLVLVLGHGGAWANNAEQRVPITSSVAEKTFIVSVAFDANNNAPFLLDNKGDVWGFKYPYSLQGLMKMPNLHHIKKIASFIALTEDGHVYTWAVSNAYKKDELAQPVFNYSDPELVDGLSNIIDVASGGGTRQFMAMRGNCVENCIFGWGYISPSSPKLIPDMPKLSLPETSMAISQTSSAVLLQDKYVISWGYNVFGSDHDPRWVRQINTLPEDTKKLVMGDDLAAITKTGHVLFWRGCSSKETRNCIHGFQYPLDDVIDMAFISDPPSVFLKKDGTIWAGDPPLLVNADGSVAYAGGYKSSPEVPKLVSGMTVPAVSIYGGPIGEGVSIYILALGADHSLWAGNLTGLRKVILNINEAEGN